MKCLTEVSLNPISRNRIADFFSYRKTYTKMFLMRFFSVVDDKLSISKRFTCFEDTLKFFIRCYAKRFFQYDHLYCLAKHQSWTNDNILYILFSNEMHTTSHWAFFLKAKKDHWWHPVAYADNFFLPFRRRRANTLRPPLVFIRARKPCNLFRLRFFGWYVRFITIAPPQGIILHKKINIVNSLCNYTESLRTLSTFFSYIYRSKEKWK